MEKALDFVVKNFKVIAACFIFFVGLYVQHEMNTQRISDLEYKCEQLSLKVDTQYQKIDAIKLDKAVFEASIKQFQSMSDDIREIRNDIKEVLKSSK